MCHSYIINILLYIYKLIDYHLNVSGQSHICTDMGGDGLYYEV